MEFIEYYHLSQKKRILVHIFTLFNSIKDIMGSGTFWVIVLVVILLVVCVCCTVIHFFSIGLFASVVLWLNRVQLLLSNVLEGS